MARSTKHSHRLPKSLRKGALPRPASDVWLAGLGALADSLRSGRGRFDALLAEGRRVQATGSPAAQDALQQAVDAEPEATVAAHAAAEALAVQAEGVVVALVPPASSLTALRARVDALASRLGAPGGPTEVTVAQTPAGWTVARGGHVAGVCRTRREAIAHGRREARAAAPSRLVVRRADGTAAETVAYG